MKLLKISLILISTLFLFTSCSQPEQKDSIDIPKTETGITSSNEGNNTDTSETVITTVHPRDEQKYYSANLLKVTDPPTEYNGEELTMTMRIENKGDEFEQAFFIFINGERIEYSTDEYTDKKAYHIYDIPDGGVVDVTLHFTPCNCKKGEKAIVAIASMLTPNYMLKDMSYVNFGFHHYISRMWPFEININQDAPESTYNKISSECERIEITEEYAIEQGYIYGSGDQTKNTLYNHTEFTMFQEDKLEGYMVAEDKLTFTVIAAGRGENESGKYLVGIYINHELQKAFGNNYYALCDADSEHEIRITANIDVSNLSGLNHIYMIAAPYNPDDTEFGVAPEKIDTRLLYVGDEASMESLSPTERIPHP